MIPRTNDTQFQYADALAPDGAIVDLARRLYGLRCPEDFAIAHDLKIERRLGHYSLNPTTRWAVA
jgi:hypothetical protein